MKFQRIRIPERLASVQDPGSVLAWLRRSRRNGRTLREAIPVVEDRVGATPPLVAAFQEQRRDHHTRDSGRLAYPAND
jgi:hypothetical protein